MEFISLINLPAAQKTELASTTCFSNVIINTQLELGKTLNEYTDKVYPLSLNILYKHHRHYENFKYSKCN